MEIARLEGESQAASTTVRELEARADASAGAAASVQQAQREAQAQVGIAAADTVSVSVHCMCGLPKMLTQGGRCMHLVDALSWVHLLIIMTSRVCSNSWVYQSTPRPCDASALRKCTASLLTRRDVTSQVAALEQQVADLRRAQASRFGLPSTSDLLQTLGLDRGFSRTPSAAQLDLEAQKKDLGRPGHSRWVLGGAYLVGTNGLY